LTGVVVAPANGKKKPGMLPGFFVA